MRRTIVISVLMSLTVIFATGMPAPGPAVAQEYGGFYAGRFSFTFSPGVLFGDTLYEGTVLRVVDIDVDIKEGFLYLFRGEYAFTDRIAVEFNIGGSTNDADADTRNFVSTLLGATSSLSSMEWDGNLFLFSVNALYQYPMDSVVPFVTVGLGLVSSSLDIEAVRSQVDGTRITLSDIEAAGFSRDLFGYDETDLDLNFGGGVKYYITDNVAVRLDVRDHVVFPEDSPFFGDAETLHMLELSAGMSYVW